MIEKEEMKQCILLDSEFWVIYFGQNAAGDGIKTRFVNVVSCKSLKVKKWVHGVDIRQIQTVLRLYFANDSQRIMLR